MKNSIVGDVARNLVGRRRRRFGKNAEQRPNAEETFPARLAPVGGKNQAPLHPEQRPALHSLAGDRSKIKIPAVGAMRVRRVGKRDAPPIEAPFASVAPPGTKIEKSERVIERSPSMRTITSAAATLRTRQWDTPEGLVGAEGYCHCFSSGNTRLEGQAHPVCFATGSFTRTLPKTTGTASHQRPRHSNRLAAPV